MKSQNPVQNTEIESQSGRVFQYAKRIVLSTPGKLLLVVAVMFSVASVPLLTRAQESNEKRTLTGNWMSTVTRIDPAPGQAPTFLGLVTYFEDGNVLEESNTTAIRSTGRGNWERIGRQQFTRSSISFRFDAARNYLGTSRFAVTITLSEDGSAYQADAVIRMYDASGNLLTTAQSTEIGQRL